MLAIHPLVRDALSAGKPVVALESTLIAHGMPWPTNLETALEVEQQVKMGGAIPATVGLLGGKLCVGLEADDLEQIARGGQTVAKCSPRDMAAVLARRQPGATTVAGTLFAARQAGIPVMATGGIGGVHRGAGLSFDVSADLPELAISPVMLVSAGAKSILDLPATLEYLETLAVPVLGYGTSEFPAFYRRNSGLPLPLNVDTDQEVVEIFMIRSAMKMPQGMLIANPIPPENEADIESINAATDQALREADQQQLTGQAITPFLLARIAQLTHGNSLAANVQLVMNNVKLATRLAVELSKARIG